MSNQRKSFVAHLDPNDKIRVKSFISSEIAYYNALVALFGSRLRTMPEIFSEVPDTLVATAAKQGIDRKDRSISERHRLFLEGLTVQQGRLLPSVRATMACEMMARHRRLAGLMDKSKTAFEIMHSMDPRVKRHVQIPRQSVTIVDKTSLRVPYANQPIIFEGQVPDLWNLLILRDNGDTWQVEFRFETYGIALGLTDVPLRQQRRQPPEKKVWRAGPPLSLGLPK